MRRRERKRWRRRRRRRRRRNKRRRKEGTDEIREPLTEIREQILFLLWLRM